MYTMYTCFDAIINLGSNVNPGGSREGSHKIDKNEVYRGLKVAKIEDL